MKLIIQALVLIALVAPTIAGPAIAGRIGVPGRRVGGGSRNQDPPAKVVLQQRVGDSELNQVVN
jgi:hypothetical protein